MILPLSAILLILYEACDSSTSMSKKILSGIFAHLDYYSGNTLSRPQDPFKDDEIHRTYQRLKELSLKNLTFLKQTATENSSNLSWELVRTSLSPEVPQCLLLTECPRL